MRLNAIVPQEVRVAAIYDKLSKEGFKNVDIHISDMDDRVDFRDLDQNIDYQQYDDDNSFMMGFEVPDNKVDRIKDLFEQEGVREIWVN